MKKLHQEIEIEFKNLLTEQEYNLLLEQLNIRSETANKQVNYYFDTADMLLKEHKSALRIRKKGGEYVLTLKEPHPDGLLETHQKCTETEAINAMETGDIPQGQVTEQIRRLTSVSEAQFNYLGELSTKRLEIHEPDGLIVLDKSEYLGKVDYELEFETSARTAGEAAFKRLLNDYGIPQRKTKNKIERFYERSLQLRRD
ncbi:CYTH domain-containing protein [Evansella clarkii]|uniref:CYTH domain-containing protein n=1 Tax=Evansella clarkii TaxID=79879 RepID=UPI001F1ACD1D|nr:CYTH domain-containing protein [Evansella clarkii]